MHEMEAGLPRRFSRLDYEMAAFVERVNSAWTAALESRDFPEDLQRFLRDTKRALYDYMEQLDQVLCIVECEKNSYIGRTKGDWRSRLPQLTRHGVRLADVRYELLQCSVCGTLYRAHRDELLRLTHRYWECPQRCGK